MLGPVFRAFDPETERTVALKAFSLDLTPEQATEFAAGLAHLATLGLDHPSIIPPIAGGADGSTAYLVEDYFAADSLDSALRQYGPAPVPDALRLVGQLAGALDFAGAAGVHHGALHPRDILVAPRELRMTGIGVSRALEQVGYRAPVRRPYSAPERVEGREWGPSADVFSLAVVAYELLTGRRPASVGESLQADPDAIAGADAAALGEVFARAFSVRSDDRYPTALAFARALKHALTGQPIEAPEEAPARGRGRRDAHRPRQGARGTAAVPQIVEPPALEGVQDAAESIEPLRANVAGDMPAIVEPPAAEGAQELTDSVAGIPADDVASAPVPDIEPPAEPEQPVVADEPVNVEQKVQEEAVRGADLPPLLPEEPELVREALLPGEPELPAPPPDALDDFDLREDVSGAPFEAAPPPAAFSSRVSTTPQSDESFTPGAFTREPLRQPAPQSFTPEPRRRAARERRRLSTASLLVMLIFGVLLGLAAGYYFAAGREPDSRASDAATADRATGGSTPPQPVASDIAIPSLQADMPPPSVPPAGGVAGEGGLEAQPPSSPGGVAAQPAAPRPGAEPKAPRRAERPSPTGRRAAASGSDARVPGRTTRGRQATAAPPTPVRGGAAVFEAPLSIVSRPPGARVFFDGHPVGVTPMTLRKVSAGSHVVRLERDGYQTWSSGIQVVAGQQNRVTASLDQSR